jgi:hypothetical protein
MLLNGSSNSTAETGRIRLKALVLFLVMVWFYRKFIELELSGREGSLVEVFSVAILNDGVKRETLGGMKELGRMLGRGG